MLDDIRIVFYDASISWFITDVLFSNLESNAFSKH